MREAPDAAPLDVQRFLGEPTRDLAAWRRLWEADAAFPIASHRGPAGRLLVLFKRLLRPLLRAPLADLWDRQKVWNLVLVERLQGLAADNERILAENEELRGRVTDLRHLIHDGLGEALDHNDALFARVDQKLDRYRREARDLAAALGGAVAAVEAGAGADAGGPGGGGDAVSELARALDERGYLELERRYRGTEEEIAGRLEVYLPYLGRTPAGREVVDLGCGRGEALALMAGAGIAARGVDASAEMVSRCRERGLAARQGDLFQALAAEPPGSLGGVVSFHVIEHLPPIAVARLTQLAWRALAPGGLLVLETPNPLSVVVAARSFWLDPTHVRPVHPETLRLFCELAGFEAVEHLELRPFPPADRLPEIDLSSLAPEQQALADRVNRLRDAVDDLLFGHQDYALVGWKPASPR
jgi:SAM-dependent methyltransferase